MDVQIGDPPVPGKRARPAKKPTWRTAPLVQTDPVNDDDAELLIDRTRGLAVAGEYGGTIAEGTWHRLAMVVDEGDQDRHRLRRRRDGAAHEDRHRRLALGARTRAAVVRRRRTPAPRPAPRSPPGAHRRHVRQPPAEPRRAHLGRAAAPRRAARCVVVTAAIGAATGQSFVDDVPRLTPSGEVELVLEGPAGEVVLGQVPCDAVHVQGVLPPASSRPASTRWRCAGSPIQLGARPLRWRSRRARHQRRRAHRWARSCRSRLASTRCSRRGRSRVTSPMMSSRAPTARPSSVAAATTACARSSRSRPSSKSAATSST